MGIVALANPTVIVNNSPVSVVPNSVSYTEGFGEQAVRTQSAGGGSVQTVLSNNVETNMSMVKFSIFNTAENIELVRTFKVNSNDNVISITGEGLTRSFNNVALTNDYEVNLGADTTIDLEFTGDPSV